MKSGSYIAARAEEERAIDGVRETVGATAPGAGADAAGAAGTSQRVISHYETVAEYPAVEVLIALAKVLHVTTDELLGLKSPPRVEVPRQPPEEKRLWRHMRLVAKLPERDQRAVLRLIDTAARAGR